MLTCYLSLKKESKCSPRAPEWLSQWIVWLLVFALVTISESWGQARRQAEPGAWGFLSPSLSPLPPILRAHRLQKKGKRRTWERYPCVVKLDMRLRGYRSLPAPFALLSGLPHHGCRSAHSLFLALCLPFSVFLSLSPSLAPSIHLLIVYFPSFSLSLPLGDRSVFLYHNLSSLSFLHGGATLPWRDESEVGWQWK